MRAVKDSNVLLYLVESVIVEYNAEFPYVRLFAIAASSGGRTGRNKIRK
jgi:hypothetical protein